MSLSTQCLQELPLDASQTDSQDAEKVFSQTSAKERDIPKEDRAKEACQENQASKGSAKKRRSDLLPSSNSKKAKTSQTAQLQEIKKEKAQIEQSSAQSPKSESKWIQFNDGLLHIDLAGRRIKDAAAADVAKLVRSILEKLRARHSSSFKSSPRVSLNLAGNRLGKTGLMILLQSLEVMENLQIDVLSLEWNRIDASAVTWLASWLSKLQGPPRKLLLSHNSAIRDVAAQHLFQSLGRISVNSSIIPWIEAKYIGIKDLDAFLEVLALHVNFCFALDADACAADRCAEEKSDKPQLHLVGILEQCLDEPTDSLESLRASDSGTSVLRLDPDSQEQSQDTVQSFGQSQDGVAKPLSPKVKEDKQDRKIKRFSTDPDSVEKERRKWASSLGKSGVADMRDTDLPAPALSFGMWDLACAEAKKSRKSGTQGIEGTQVQRKGSSESISRSPNLKVTEQAAQVSKVTLRTLGSFSEKDTDYVALKAVVDGRVKRKTELWKALTITESEKWLRQKCLVDELCKQIFEEGFKTATSSAGSWETYLKTSIGHQHVLQWLDRKLSDATKACTRR